MINDLPIPAKFKMPTCKYTGSEDPLTHVENFKIQMDLQGIRDDLRCRIFPATLTDTAQQWFTKLPPGRITSWDEFEGLFYTQFSSARQIPAELGDLVAIKQKPDEPLKDYIQRFMQEATKVKNLSDDGKRAAIMGGILVGSRLWKDTRRKPTHTMRDFLDRADEFIKLEEAERNAQNFNHTKNKKNGTSSNSQSSQGGNARNGSNNGKRGNNSNGGNNNDNKRLKNTPEPPRRDPIPRFTTYSLLLDTRENIYNATHSVVPYRKPYPMRKDISKRDMNKFCRFHNDYGHDTDECNNLKEEIEFLIRQNNPNLKRYVRRDNDRPQRQQQQQAVGDDQQLLPPPVAGRLDIISGGPHLAGNSGKSREKYARSLRHELGNDVLAVQERAPKQPRYEHELITFSEEDTKHVRYPHNDPLVVEVQIANMIVARTMIDNGSSANILFKSSLERMGLGAKDLEPCEHLIYGFTGSGMAPAGLIKLPLTVGTTPKSVTIMALFVVLDTISPYNALIGRPTLYDLKAVTSIFHLLVKFPTKGGIGYLKGNQIVARECYNLSITTKEKAAKSLKAAASSSQQ
ncbi:hypothetical protein CsatB_015930 [Cannabis sativa]